MKHKMEGFQWRGGFSLHDLLNHNAHPPIIINTTLSYFMRWRILQNMGYTVHGALWFSLIST